MHRSIFLETKKRCKVCIISKTPSNKSIYPCKCSLVPAKLNSHSLRSEIILFHSCPYSHLAMKDFKKDALDTHNEFRAKHGAPAMKWSSKLEARAQKWANEIANKGYLQHDSQKEDGENIACMKGMEFFIFRTFALPNSSLMLGFHIVVSRAARRILRPRDKRDR